MILLGISGKKRAGKDTICGFIKEIVAGMPEYTFQHINFADTVYEEVVCALWPAIHRDNKLAIESRVNTIKADKDSFRTLLQWWGTDWRRKFFDENYWINKWAARVSQVPDNAVVVCSDVRFLNELQAVRGCKGYAWRVRRDGQGIDTHQSETELDAVKDWDKYIPNHSKLEQLELRVNLEFQALLTKHNNTQLK